MLATSDVDPIRDLSYHTNVHVVAQFEESERSPDNYMSTSWIYQLTKIKLWSFTECNLLCCVDSDVVFYSDAMLGVARER
jgi:alpha-N-acetylglucosamine transferase